MLKVTLAFLSSRFSTWPKKSDQKFQYLQNKKCFLDKIKKTFLVIFKRFSFKQIKQISREGENQALMQQNHIR